jgi:hypothetical protein
MSLIDLEDVAQVAATILSEPDHVGAIGAIFYLFPFTEVLGEESQARNVSTIEIKLAKKD